MAMHAYLDGRALTRRIVANLLCFLSRLTYLAFIGNKADCDNLICELIQFYVRILLLASSMKMPAGLSGIRILASR